MTKLPALRELAEAAARVTVGTVFRRDWELQTSNSFRRIGAAGDGDVLCGTIQRSDGHPDLLAKPEVLEYIVAAQPRVVLELLDEIERLRLALSKVTP
jgi:hypothetical protein